MTNLHEQPGRSDQSGSGVSVENEKSWDSPAGLEVKGYDWGRIDIGDCTMFYANLTLYSDGLAEFRSAVSTDDSGDVWLVKSLALMNSLGTTLFVIPQFNGPQMDVEDMVYNWGRFRQVDPLPFPPQIFPNIRKVLMTCHC